jgi:hypothetical protein
MNIEVLTQGRMAYNGMDSEQHDGVLSEVL